MPSNAFNRTATALPRPAVCHPSPPPVPPPPPISCSLTTSSDSVPPGGQITCVIGCNNTTYAEFFPVPTSVVVTNSNANWSPLTNNGHTQTFVWSKFRLGIHKITVTFTWPNGSTCVKTKTLTN